MAHVLCLSGLKIPRQDMKTSDVRPKDVHISGAGSRQREPEQGELGSGSVYACVLLVTWMTNDG